MASSLLAHSNLFLLILIVVSALPLVQCEREVNLEFPCKARQWYNTEVNRCVACTVCEDAEYVKRACHLDRNTICAPSHELRFHIESLHLTKEPNEVSFFFDLACFYRYFIWERERMTVIKFTLFWSVLCLLFR